MSNVKVSIRLNFCRSVPPEFLWSFLSSTLSVSSSPNHHHHQNHQNHQVGMELDAEQEELWNSYTDYCCHHHHHHHHHYHCIKSSSSSLSTSSPLHSSTSLTKMTLLHQERWKCYRTKIIKVWEKNVLLFQVFWWGAGRCIVCGNQQPIHRSIGPRYSNLNCLLPDDSCLLVVDNTVDGEDNLEEKTMEVIDIMM